MQTFCRAFSYILSPFFKVGSVILFLHVRIYEAEGEKVFDAVEAVGSVLAIEQDAYGALVAVFHLQYHLAAGSAWRDRRLEETIPSG